MPPAVSLAVNVRLPYNIDVYVNLWYAMGYANMPIRVEEVSPW